MRWFSFTVICLAAVSGLDRWLKWQAQGGVYHDFGWGQFTLLKNRALVFSWPAPNWVAIIMMIVAMIAVAGFAYRCIRRHDTLRFIGTLLILLGAVSNLYDRLAFGFVIDWAYLGRWWPVFNLADVMITVGLLLLLFRRSTGLTNTTA